MNSIFISYASRDSDFALKLAGDLRERGHEAITFGDLKTEGKASSDLDQQLAGAIASASYFIPILTPTIQDHYRVEWEITAALKKEALGEVMILPALREPCVLPEPLGVRSPVDFSKSYAEGLHDLCDRLSAPLLDLKTEDPGLESLKLEATDALFRQRAELQGLSPEQFEEVVARIFNGLGYEVAWTQLVSRDGGVDLVAVGGNDKSKQRFLVQCKWYAPASRIAVELVKSARRIHADLQNGQAHVVTTCSFLVPKESGKASERLTCSRWEISPVDWDSVKTWIAPFINVFEPSTTLDPARDRYAELIDKKFGSRLTEAEQAELLRLRAYLDEAESDFYEPIKKRLDLALAKSSPSSER